MRYALLSDLHANVRAWSAVYRDLRSQGVDTILCLGDVVGYGPSPARVLEELYNVCDNFVLGNHDAVVGGQLDASCFNDEARFTIEWTRKELNDDAAHFFQEVPLTLEGDNFLLTHAEVAQPGRFDYLYEPADAMPHFAACDHRLIFIGHTHFPCAFYSEAPGQGGYFPNEDLSLNPGLRYLVNVGSVGDPRNGDTRAHYVIYDSEADTIQFRKVPFDVEAYRHDLVQSGLPTRPILFDYLGRPLPEARAPAPLQSAKDSRALSEMQPVDLSALPASEPSHATLQIHAGPRKQSATFRQLQEQQNRSAARWLAPVAGALGLLAVAGGAWWFLRGNQDTPRTLPPPETAAPGDPGPEAPPEEPPLPVYPSDAVIAWSFEEPSTPYRPEGWLAKAGRTAQSAPPTAREDERGASIALSGPAAYVELKDARLLQLPATAPWCVALEVNYRGSDGHLLSHGPGEAGPESCVDWRLRFQGGRLTWDLVADGQRLRLTGPALSTGIWTPVQLVWDGTGGTLWVDGKPVEQILTEVTGDLPPRHPGGFRIGGRGGQKSAVAGIDRVQIYYFQPADTYLEAWARNRLPHFNRRHAALPMEPDTEEAAAWDRFAGAWSAWAFREDPVAAVEGGPAHPTSLAPWYALLQDLRTQDRRVALQERILAVQAKAKGLPVNTSFDAFAKALRQTAMPFVEETQAERGQLQKVFQRRVLAERSPLVPGVPVPLLDLAEETARLLVVQDTPGAREQLVQAFARTTSSHPDLASLPAYDTLKQEAESLSRLPETVMQGYEEDLGVQVVIGTVEGSVTGVVRAVEGRAIRILGRFNRGIQANRVVEFGELVPAEMLKRLPASDQPVDEAMRGIVEAALGKNTATVRFAGLSELLGLHLMKAAPGVREAKAAAEMDRLRERMDLDRSATLEDWTLTLFRKDSPKRRAGLDAWLHRFDVRYGTQDLPVEDQRVINAVKRYVRYSTLPVRPQCMLSTSFLLTRIEKDTLVPEHPPRTELDLTSAKPPTRHLSWDGPLLRFDRRNETQLDYEWPISFRKLPITLMVHTRPLPAGPGGIPHQDLITFYDHREEEAPTLKLHIQNPGRWMLTASDGKNEPKEINPKAATKMGLRQFHYLTIDRDGKLNWWIDGVQVAEDRSLGSLKFSHLRIGGPYEITPAPPARPTKPKKEFYTGTLKDLQVYSRLWPDQEREQLFAYLREKQLLVNTSSKDAKGLLRFAAPE